MNSTTSTHIWISVDMTKTQPNYDNNNNKVLGKFKDEHDDNIFAKHIGLKPNMYCCVNDDEQALKQRKRDTNINN